MNAFLRDKLPRLFKMLAKDNPWIMTIDEDEDDGDITFPYVLLAKKNRNLEVVPAETITGARALQNKGSKTSPEKSYIWIGKLDLNGKYVIIKLTAHIQAHARLIPTAPQLQTVMTISSRRFQVVKNPLVRRATLAMPVTPVLPTVILVFTKPVVDPIDGSPSEKVSLNGMRSMKEGSPHVRTQGGRRERQGARGHGDKLR